MRLSQRTGSHMTTFVGLEWGFRHGGLAGNFGLSLAGGGVDINVADWFAYGIAARISKRLGSVEPM